MSVCRTHLVLALIVLYLGMAHCWDIAVSVGTELEFYTNDTKTDTVHFKSHNLSAISYDEVHNMMLFIDKQSDHDAICGYNLDSTDIKCFIKRTGSNIQDLAFDPATELLFFTDTKDRSINWISLKDQGSEDNVYGNLLVQLDMDVGTVKNIVVDSCRGYIYWTNTYIYTGVHMERARFDGSERKLVYNFLPVYSFAIDPQTHTNFYFDGAEWLRSFYLQKVDFRENYLKSEISEILLSNHNNPLYFYVPKELTVSNDYLYWMNSSESFSIIFQLPKHESYDAKPRGIIKFYMKRPLAIAANYRIRDQVQGIQDCETLSSVLATTTVTNSSKNIVKTKQKQQTTEAAQPTEAEQTIVAEQTTEAERITEVEQTTEADQTTVVSETTEAEQTTVVSETTEAEQTTVVSETTEAEQTTVVSEIIEAEQTTVVSETTEADQTTVVSEKTEAEQTTVVSETIEAEQTTVVSETTEADQTTVVSETTEAEQTTIVSKTTEAEQTTEFNLTCFHGLPVCKCIPGYTGEQCNVSVCENHCLQGYCSFNDEGIPKCRCNVGYFGERCEHNTCNGYCLNDGDCSINEKNETVCQCNGSYEGDRCEVSRCMNYCFQGNCSFNDEGHPECRCNTGYTGERCEVSVCYGYCLNNGECMLNEEDEPVCECDGSHEGSRCEAIKNDLPVTCQ